MAGSPEIILLKLVSVGSSSLTQLGIREVTLEVISTKGLAIMAIMETMEIIVAKDIRGREYSLVTVEVSKLKALGIEAVAMWHRR